MPLPAQATFLRILRLLLMTSLGMVSEVSLAAEVQVFHADSLAGPMRELKKAFETQRPGATINLTSGVSRQLAERIVKGEVCDVFAPSSPAVIDEDMMNRKVAGTDKDAATWYVVFSANEMVIITAKGNPLGIRRASDLAKPGLRFVRVNGEKDLATARTVGFLQRATAQEGDAALAQKIVDGAIAEPGKAVSVPDAVNAVRQGKADAAVVYYSAAVAARNDIEIVRFADSVNMSEAIRNAATVPDTARNATDATAFVGFLLSPEAQAILKETGQPPVVPAIRKGAVPTEIK
ncbi:MAG: molybdate ABC transporter substrate-binding protein [Burkholderiaceae bacterium]